MSRQIPSVPPFPPARPPNFDFIVERNRYQRGEKNPTRHTKGAFLFTILSTVAGIVKFFLAASSHFFWTVFSFCWSCVSRVECYAQTELHPHIAATANGSSFAPTKILTAFTQLEQQFPLAADCLGKGARFFRTVRR
jgi:hypothetical protein